MASPGGGSYVDPLFQPMSHDDTGRFHLDSSATTSGIDLGVGNNGQYKVIHQLGSRGFATAWLF
jgi:hypothetical protein